ncbi:hypothetical protein [Methanosarcina sp. 1.H.A.2.2]|uniref:hypothetical protein n=1 Tax=Methanosarcina sp. 1.H.A.2.2 TaxID=1483601 RepID=UPI0019110826|nr:hypothetical protein [Methanosarcina sp. 1.H.A.2.2]
MRELYLPRKEPGELLFLCMEAGTYAIAHNKYVAKELQRRGSGTLLFDLLRPGKYNEYNLWLYK